MEDRTIMGMKLMRIFTWTGIVLVTGLILAQGIILRFVPPTSPALSAQQISDLYANNSTRMQIGCLIQIVFWTFYTTWTIPITLFIRKIEIRTYKLPILTFASIVACGGGIITFFVIPMTWAVIAFRAGTISPDIVFVMNDWVWFVWLYAWPPFVLWLVVVAIAIFLDRSAEPIYPRWIAFAALWTGVLMVPAGFIGFFKTGPFAYNGVIGFFVPATAFFGWMLAITYLTFKAINDFERRGESLID